MVVKVCSTCKREKNSDEFNNCARNKDGKANKCRDCAHIYYRLYEPANENRREQKRREARVKRIERRNYVKVLKEQTGCVDCGIKDFRILEFDHLPSESTKKLYAVSDMVATGHSMKTFLAEIAKCEIVCANCHRIRTWNRSHKLG